MLTFERIGTIFLRQCNWCWNYNGGKSLQSVARTGIEVSTVHHR